MECQKPCLNCQFYSQYQLPSYEIVSQTKVLLGDREVLSKLLKTDMNSLQDMKWKNKAFRLEDSHDQNVLQLSPLLKRVVRFLHNVPVGIIHPLHNGSRGGGYLDLLRYCLIYMESHSTERYDRRRWSQKLKI